MKFIRQLRLLVRRKTLETEMAEEMRLHLELQAERNMKSGMAADEARDAARREFGGVEQIKEQVREQRGWTWLESVAGDLRFAWRTLWKHPGFAVTAIGVLALAIGANVTVVNLFQTLLFAPPAYHRPDEIVRVIEHDTTNPKARRDLDYPTYRDLREANDVFSGTLAYRPASVGLIDARDSRRAMASLVSSNFFAVLGVAPEQGRPFLLEEERPGSGARVAIVSEAYARKHDYDPALVGSLVKINGRPFTLVGIMPAGFTGTMNLFATEIWLPFGADDVLQDPADAATAGQAASARLAVLGRLKPAVTREAAESALKVFASRPDVQRSSEEEPWTFRLESPSRFATSDNDRGVAFLGGLFLAMSGVVLLVACLNLASFLLARGATRQQEMAIRLALGGSRGRIVRQLLTEAFVLAFAGGVIGAVLAIWSSDLLIAWLARRTPAELAWSTDPQPVLILVAFGFSVIGTLCFALGPALKLSRTRTSALSSSRATSPVGRRRSKWFPRNSLLVLQIALSLALVTAAGLFIRGANLAASAECGLKTERDFLVEVDASLGGRRPDEAQALYQLLLNRFAALPGVESAGVATDVPLSGQDFEVKVSRLGAENVAEADKTGGRRAVGTKTNSVGGDYFKTVGLPLLRGRAFTNTETELRGGPAVAIINDVLARELWPDGNALGQRIVIERGSLAEERNERRPFRETESVEIVGIVPPTRHVLYEKKASPEIYLPLAREFRSHVFFHVKFSVLPAGAEDVQANVLRETVSATDAALPILSLKTFARHLDDNVQTWTTRAAATLFSAFGALALTLAVVGVYGLVAYSVAARTKEIGIRMALGARPEVVQRMILREGAVTVGFGLSIGLVLALATGRLVSALLYGVGATDPTAFTAALVLLGSTALLACWAPARRATKVDPMVALRTE